MGHAPPWERKSVGDPAAMPGDPHTCSMCRASTRRSPLVTRVPCTVLFSFVLKMPAGVVMSTKAVSGPPAVKVAEKPKLPIWLLIASRNAVATDDADVPAAPIGQETKYV